MPRVYPQNSEEEDAQHAPSAHTQEQAARRSSQDRSASGDINERDFASANSLTTDDSDGKGRVRPLPMLGTDAGNDGLTPQRIHHESSMINLIAKSASGVEIIHGDMDRITVFVGPFIFHPYSTFRLSWDLWGTHPYATSNSCMNACMDVPPRTLLIHL
jgi:hypothetical protein